MLLINLYQIVLGPFLGGRCRFYPSCSEYSKQAFTHFNPLKAAGLTFLRLCKCQPLHPGGFDPLNPEKKPLSNFNLPENQL